MNIKKLAIHFPELGGLPEEERLKLLDIAYKDAISPENKLRNWRANLIAALIMTSLCFLFVLVIRPAIGMSQQTSAMLLMLIAFPAYLIFQQRRLIKQIRISLQKFLP